MDPVGGLRSPLYVRLHDRATDARFVVVMSHFAGGEEEQRIPQAKGIRQWIEDQPTTAAINISLLNVASELASQEGSQVVEELTRDDAWEWVKPQQLAEPDGSAAGQRGGKSSESGLTATFVGGAARAWEPASRLITRRETANDDLPSGRFPLELVVRP